MKFRALIIVVSLAALAGCGESSSATPDTDNTPVDGKADRYDKAPELELVDEYSLEDLLDHPDTSRFEASGVAIQDGRVVIVFDNLRRFASLNMDYGDAQWLGDSDGYGLDDDDRVRNSNDFEGFEGVAIAPDGSISLAVEAIETEDKDILPVVVHWSAAGSTYEWLDYEVESVNDGIEGLGYLEVDGQTWLAALCETGKCDTRSRGRLILRDDAGTIDHVNLPKGLDFADFSSLAIDGNRLAVGSQESSRIWVGTAFFDEEGELDFETEGVYNYPRQRDGDVDFCTVEGLAWLNDNTLLAVSDLEKSGQHRRCENHAERLHVFELP